MFLGCKVLRWVRISPLSFLFVQCIHVVPNAVYSCGCLMTFKKEQEGLEKDEKKLKGVRRRGKEAGREGAVNADMIRRGRGIGGGDNQPSYVRLYSPRP